MGNVIYYLSFCIDQEGTSISVSSEFKNQWGILVYRISWDRIAFIYPLFLEDEDEDFCPFRFSSGGILFPMDICSVHRHFWLSDWRDECYYSHSE